MTTSERENLVIEFLRTTSMRSLAYRFLHNQDDVDDAMQTTAMIALRKLRLDHPQPWGWLGLTLKNECFRMLRMQRRYADNGLPVPERSIDVNRADLIAARDSFQTLKAAEQTTLSEFASGYSYREIADRQGWTRTKVNRCMAEGSKALRNMVTLEA